MERDEWLAWDGWREELEAWAAVAEMRERRDSWLIAGWKRAHDLRGCARATNAEGDGHVSHDPVYAAIEPAQPGDVWRGGGFLHHPEAGGGFALTCPKVDCEQGAHDWWHAYDCPASKSPDGVCKAGAGRTSCWTWTGSIEDGSLTASPSLHCVAERGGCGYHGWLQAGQMTPG